MFCCCINKHPVSAHSPRLHRSRFLWAPKVSCLGQLDRLCSTDTPQDDTSLNPSTAHLHAGGYSGSFWLAPALESLGLRVCPSRCQPRLAQGLEPVLGTSAGKVWPISRQNRADGNFPSRKARCFSCYLPLCAVEVPKALELCLSQPAGLGFSPAGSEPGSCSCDPRVSILWAWSLPGSFFLPLDSTFEPSS